MRYLITVLLSALLIWKAPHNLNNQAVSAPHQPSNTHATIAVSPLHQIAAKPFKELAVISPHEALMLQAGIPEKDWEYTDYIVRHESSWNPRAFNPSSGSCGLAQALPCKKMASHGKDYRHNPVTQLRWMKEYVSNRYGSFRNAAAFWNNNEWY